jgi:hypothetical protein
MIEADEDWLEAAKVLMTIPLDSANRSVSWSSPELAPGC